MLMQNPPQQSFHTRNTGSLSLTTTAAAWAAFYFSLNDTDEKKNTTTSSHVQHTSKGEQWTSKACKWASPNTNHEHVAGYLHCASPIWGLPPKGQWHKGNSNQPAMITCHTLPPDKTQQQPSKCISGLTHQLVTMVTQQAQHIWQVGGTAWPPLTENPPSQSKLETYWPFPFPTTWASPKWHF